MAKKLRSEDLVLNVIVNGDQGRAEMQKLERQITDLGSANERLEQKQQKPEAAGKSGSRAWQENKAAIAANNEAIRLAQDRLEQLRKGLDLTNMSLWDLQREQGRLTQLMRNATPGTENFARYSAQLEKVKARITELNGTAKSTGLSLGKLADGLNRYVGIITAGFAIFALLVTGARAAGNAYAQLDDKVADVMKTTGLAKEVVYDMNESLSKVNTRTAQLELLGLAQQAGKLRISARRDVEDFVLAADKIGVALGEDLGDKDEAIRQIGKIVDLFKVKEEFGMGDGMLKVGSVINALGAASTANEGYIVDFTKRFGGIAVPAKMSVTQVAGLGATLDALGQASKASSTAVGKVITGMFRKTSEYAKVAGMDVKSFKKLMTEDINEAFIKVLEGMQGGGLDRVVAMLGALGEKGARVTTSLGTLASNTQKLREQQALANDEFGKGTSVLNEYETKNNSAQADLEKAQKSFQQRLVELGKSLQPLMTYTTTGFATVVKALTGVVKVFKEYKGVIVTTMGVIVSYIAVKKMLVFYSVEYQKALLREAVTIKSATAATQLLAAAKLLLAGHTRAAGIAFKAFWASIGPIGWLVTAVSAVATGMALFGNKTKEAAGAMADMVMQLGQERDTHDDLKKALYATTEGSQARADVIKLINERYGEYLDNMLTEKDSTEDIAKALFNASQMMEENIKVKIWQQEMQKIQQDQFDAEKKPFRI
ncbi:MAG: phage tail tape measure protein [Rikenellaceae bacterium]|nr:phage tail tape measure protein [Rikenellaceae bacterium]